jgi:hypothetical protein
MRGEAEGGRPARDFAKRAGRPPVAPPATRASARAAAGTSRRGWVGPAAGHPARPWVADRAPGGGPPTVAFAPGGNDPGARPHPPGLKLSRSRGGRARSASPPPILTPMGGRYARFTPRHLYSQHSRAADPGTLSARYNDWLRNQRQTR